MFWKPPLLTKVFFFCEKKHQQGESLKLFTRPNIFPRHPGPPPEVRYLDPKNIPKTPSQEVFGCLGFWKLDVPRRHSLQRGKHHSLNLEILLCFAEFFCVNYSDFLGVHLDFRCCFLFIFHLEIFNIFGGIGISFSLEPNNHRDDVNATVQWKKQRWYIEYSVKNWFDKTGFVSFLL